MDNRKISIIGDGAVGSSIAYTLFLKEAVREIVIVDVNKNKAEGDALDMGDGNSFLAIPKIVRAGEYKDVAGSHIVVITAGAAQKPGETRLDLLHKNASIFNSICAELKPYLEKETIVLVVSNPVDILTYFAYRKLGLPANQVFGSGTVLDTSRLKTAISLEAKVDPRSVHTFVLGEHGDSEVPIWSLTSVGGLSLGEYLHHAKSLEDDEKTLAELHNRVKNAAYVIIDKKGSTNYAVALAVSRIISAIINHENSILTVSAHLESAFDGKLQDVYFSLPCVVGSHGIREVLHPVYGESEKEALLKSGLALKDKLKDLPL